MSVAYVSKARVPPTRAKALPLQLLAGGPTTPPDESLPRGTDYREGSLDLFLKWPGIRPLVVEATSVLRKIFGTEVQFALERFDDPEATEPTTQLYLLVRAPMDLQQAMALFRQFDEQWWIENVQRAQGRLVIDLEPV